MQEIKDVWQVLDGAGAEAQAEYHRIECEFLAANGYPEAKEKWTPALMDALRKKMHGKGERIKHTYRYDGETGRIVIGFVLFRGKRRVLAVSSKLMLQGVPLDAPVPYDEGDGA